MKMKEENQIIGICPYCRTHFYMSMVADGIYRCTHCNKLSECVSGRLIKVKKVSFRVRRIYYDQFVVGTKHEELRALKRYWIKILCPYVPQKFCNHPEVRNKDTLSGFMLSEIKRCRQPKIAVISTPRQPTLRFKIDSIWIDEPESILGRELSEQGKLDIPTELCIVTRMGKQIE